jgi:hypothetical protein
MTEAEAKRAAKEFAPTTGQKKKARDDAKDKGINMAKGSIIVKPQLCGKYCGTCPHGPYAWHVYNGDWTYIGSVGGGIGTGSVGKKSKESEVKENDKSKKFSEELFSRVIGRGQSRGDADVFVRDGEIFVRTEYTTRDGETVSEVKEAKAFDGRIEPKEGRSFRTGENPNHGTVNSFNLKDEEREQIASVLGDDFDRWKMVSKDASKSRVGGLPHTTPSNSGVLRIDGEGTDYRYDGEWVTEYGSDTFDARAVDGQYIRVTSTGDDYKYYKIKVENGETYVSRPSEEDIDEWISAGSPGRVSKKERVLEKNEGSIYDEPNFEEYYG